MKRIIAFIFGLLMLFGTTACSFGPEKETDNSQTDTKSPSETTGLTSTLPKKDYNGETITFLTMIKNEFRNSTQDVLADDLIGEAMNDSMYYRNIAVEDKYNVNISYIECKDGEGYTATLEKYVNSGDDTVDVTLYSMALSLEAGLKGYLYEIDEIPHIDLNKPWWYQQSLKETSIANVNYFIMGDLNYSAWTNSYVMFFNKKMLQDNNYDPSVLYDAVRDGKWTFDYMTTVANSIYNDVNGNSAYDNADNYGFTSYAICNDCFWMGSGIKFVEKDNDDIPYITINEKFYNLFDKVNTFLNANTTHYCNTRTNDTSDSNLSRYMFVNGRALFLVIEIAEREYGIQGMEQDFGVLPLPKYDETQQNYYTYSHQDNCGTTSVPTSTTDLDMVGRILEDMSYFSYKYTRPAFYDMILHGRLARDEDTVEMLDIITNNFTYDLGLIFQRNGFNLINVTIRGAVLNKGANLTSVIESAKSKNDTIIKNIVEKVQANAST